MLSFQISKCLKLKVFNKHLGILEYHCYKNVYDYIYITIYDNIYIYIYINKSLKCVYNIINMKIKTKE